ncbi:30S ribosomal protein S6 [Patescibacteria group bacterium]|nr:30S ribosomal protein S6 [Patescibacteria group bacterium]MBU1721264.1 30S ribosomal protein S6 [Patescibacteria group bacterium]MBU1901028.1 30S ribosomal protein S6 [Patescibacteria group bacterium]
MSKHYELLCIFPGTLGEDELPGKIASVEQVVLGAGATGIKVEDMGKSRLAYPMKHIRYGYFYLVTFSVEPKAVSGIQGKLRIIPDLLRAIVRLYNPRTKVTLEERQSEMKEQQEQAVQHKSDHVQAVVAPIKKEKKVSEVKKEVVKEVAAPASEKKVEEAPKEEKEEVVPVKKAEKTEKVEEARGKIDMDDIDKKLDEILDQSIANI